MKIRIACFWTLGLALAISLLAGSPAQGAYVNIESGQWYSHSVNTNTGQGYVFYAEANDKVIVNVINESIDLTSFVPDGNVENAAGTPLFTWTNTLGGVSTSLTIGATGWFDINILNPHLTNAPHTFSVSIMRMPHTHAPFSYNDLDVGPIRSGEYREGTIGDGTTGRADLDAATFAVSNRCTVQMRIGQETLTMAPNLFLYDPSGQPVTNDFPPEYRGEIIATLSQTGIYMAVADDYLNTVGRYAISQVTIGAPLVGNDLDVGTILKGETKQGKINVPGDLDAATFTGSTGDVVNITMSELDGVDYELNPVIELYAPNGTRLARDEDIFEESAVITNLLMTNGLFTIICKDAEDRYNVNYSLVLLSTNIYPTPPAPLPIPTGVTASDGTYLDKVTVSWDPLAGITNYSLWRRHLSGNNYVDVQLCLTNVTSIEDSDVQTNVAYYYRVKAESNGMYGAFSSEDSGFCQQMVSGQAIESGQYYSEGYNILSTNYPSARSKNYTFFAIQGETIIVRLGNTADSYPDFAMYNPNSTPANFTQYAAHEYHLAITNYGWHWFACSLPSGYTSMTFNVSMLRTPNIPLSYSDLDVGTLPMGQPKLGIINVSSDLDAGFFTVTNPCAIQIRMGQKDVRLVPNIILYSPAGTEITSDYPPEYRAEISATLTNLGVYTIVCADKFNGMGSYALTMVEMPGTLEGTDTDIGPIVSGETKYGTISEPGDMDTATFNAMTGDVINVAMSDVDIELNPVMDFYDPAGNRIRHATDPYERSATITNLTLTNSGVYTLVLKDAQDRYGVSYSVTMEFQPGSPSLLLNKPLPPSNLTASDGIYADNILVSWTASISTNVTGYDIWRSGDALTFTQITTNRPSTTYQDYNVQTNTLYYYKVAARNSYVISDFSATNSGHCGTLLPTPGMTLTASDGTYSNYILVSWSASGSTNITGYDVWRKNWTNDYVQISSNWFSQAFQDYDAIPNLIYTYRVNARNSFGVSAFSPEDTGYCGTTNVLGTRRALLVGIDHYSYGPGDLNACTNDANGMRDTMLLADPSNRWQAANLTTLTDALATKEAIRSNLFAMATASGAGDLALYFQSSHGGQSAGSNPSNTYICTYNANYTDAELGTDLALFRPETTVIIILDTCYSGGMYKLDGSPETEWLFVERVMAHYQQAKAQQYKSMGLAAPKDLGANIAFMTACDYNEFSWESDYYGLYTGYLILGCSLALTDTNQDKQYYFLELHNYAAQKAVLTQPTQHAQTYNSTLLGATIARALPVNPTPIHFVNNDFDGDSASDFAAFNPSTGLWRIASLKRWIALAYDNFIWGGPGFKALDGDYDGDRASDLAVYNTTSGEWRIASLKQAIVLLPSAYFGGAGQTPVCGDYNGDQISDAALYEQPDGYWYILTTTGVQLVWGDSYTGAGFIPISGDYDGDQINDLAMYHVKSGYWYIKSLVNGTLTWGTLWGDASMTPVSGDYDGDGYSDLAVYQSTTGKWYIYSLRLGTTIASGAQLGGPGYTPVAGDYDGDGYFDLVVYQPATGYWFFSNVSGTQSFSLEYPIGGPGYIPVLPTWQ